MKEVTLYKTNDGKLFYNKKEAEAHENNTLEDILKNELKNMPYLLPLFSGEMPQLMDSGYRWFMVNTKDEEDNLLKRFEEVYGTLYLKYCGEEKDTPYPKTLGVNVFRHLVVSVECLKNTFESLKEDYKKWMTSLPSSSHISY